MYLFAICVTCKVYVCKFVLCTVLYMSYSSFLCSYTAQTCTTGSESITTLHAFLFNKDVAQAQQTVSLVILMGHLAVVQYLMSAS